MFRTVIATALLFAAAALVAGCGGGSASAPEKLYDVKGQVVSVEKEKNRVVLDHEDIPGLMKAMQMPFSVADPKLLEGLKPGDAVAGKLKAEGGKYVITELKGR